MQRLSDAAERLDQEGGAVAVLVAFLMLPLLGFAAIAVDAGALYAERRQLQNGADAAALAIAQDCARGDCGDVTATAVGFASANAGDEVADAVPAVAGNTVAVDTSTRRAADGGVGLAHWFAPVLGFDATTVRARSAAAWGTPSGGQAMLPIIFSWCAFQAATGGYPSTDNEVVIRYDNVSSTGCTGPSGLAIPGGFGWLHTNAGPCRTASAANNNVDSDPGNDVPNTCSAAYFQSLLHTTVLLPVYDVADSSGNNAWYQVYGYAAFHITGYRFSGSGAFNAGNACSGNHRCIKGYFTEFVDLADAFVFGPAVPDLGATLVRLTE